MGWIKGLLAWTSEQLVGAVGDPWQGNSEGVAEGEGEVGEEGQGGARGGRGSIEEGEEAAAEGPEGRC
jgi:hypothetical protein